MKSRLLLLLLACGAMQAADPNRPGARNPLGDPSRDREPRRPDDELFLAGTVDGAIALGSVADPGTARFSSWRTGRPVAAGAGRILGAPFHQGALVYESESGEMELSIVSLARPGEITFSQTTLTEPEVGNAVEVVVADVDGQDEGRRRDPEAPNAEYRDEVVVAYPFLDGGVWNVRLKVFACRDTGFPSDPMQPPEPDEQDQIVLSTALLMDGSDGRVILRAGDLDGDDGAKEIVVGYLNPDRRFVVTVVSYIADLANPIDHQLKERTVTPVGGSTPALTAASGGYDMVVGRFDKDRQCTVVFLRGQGNDGIHASGWWLAPQPLEPGESILDHELTQYAYTYESLFAQTDAGAVLELVGESRVRGALGRGYSPKLFVLAQTAGRSAIVRFNVEEDSNHFGPDPIEPVWMSGEGQGAGTGLGLLAGNFLETRTVDTTAEHPASLYVLNPGGPNQIIRVAVDAQGRGTTESVEAFVPPSPETSPRTLANLQLVASDIDGDDSYYAVSGAGTTLYLGWPQHFFIAGLQTYDLVLHEPPKHIDYLPEEGIVNVTQSDEFLTRVETTGSTERSFEKRKRSDWVLSQSDFSEESLGFGLELFGAAKAGLTDDSKKSFDQVNFHAYEEAAFTEESVTVTETQVAKADDQLVLRHRDIDVWRFPILGRVTTEEVPATAASFYEIVVPTDRNDGDGQSPRVFVSGRLWPDYQPVHLNGNLLTYPTFTGEFSPADLGAFVEHARAEDAILARRNGYPDGSPNALAETRLPTQQLIYPPEGAIQSFTPGSGTEITIQFAETVTTSTEVSSGGTLRTVEESSQGIELGGDFAGLFSLGSSSALGSTTISEESWGSARITESTVSTATQLAIETPGDVTSERDYRFWPVFYFATDGALKCAHYISLEVNKKVGSFWADRYDGPDLALALPERITRSDGDYRLNTALERKKLKGFFLRRGTVTTGILNDSLPATPERPGDLLASAPLAGEPVQLQVRVYNLSLPDLANGDRIGTAAEDVVVRFEAVRLQNGVEEPNRTLIGDVVIESIPPGGMTNAFVVWDTSGFAPASPAELQQVRVYVTLDPNDLIPNETHEWRDRYCNPLTDSQGRPIDDGLEQGQNNEGFAELSVAARDAGPTTAGLNRAPVRLAADSLRPDLSKRSSASRNSNRTDAVAVGDSVPVQLRIESARLVRRVCYVRFYATAPGGRPELFAIRKVFGVDARLGTLVGATWRPSAVGCHRIEAFLDGGDEPEGATSLRTEICVEPQRNGVHPAARSLAGGAEDAGPEARPDEFQTTPGTPLLILHEDLLENDSGEAIDFGCLQERTLFGEPTRGTIVTNPNDTISYDPGNRFDFLTPGESAEDQFLYTIQDELGRVSRAAVTIRVVHPVELEVWLRAERTEGNSVRLLWEADAARLEGASAATGPWKEIANAASGIEVRITGDSAFFRLVLP